MSATAVNLLSPAGLRDPMRNPTPRTLASEGGDAAAGTEARADSPDFHDALAAGDPGRAESDSNRAAAMSGTPPVDIGRLTQNIRNDDPSAPSDGRETGAERTVVSRTHLPEAGSVPTVAISATEAGGPPGPAGPARSVPRVSTATIAEDTTRSAETGAEPGRSGRSGGNGTTAGGAPNAPEAPVATPAGGPVAASDTLSAADPRSVSRPADASARTVIATPPARSHEAIPSPDGVRIDDGPESRERASHAAAGPPHAAARGEQPGASSIAAGDAATVRVAGSSPDMPVTQESGRGGDAPPVEDVPGDWGRGEARGESARAEQARPDASRPVTPRNLSAQVAEGVRVSPDGRVEIALQPEELGRVRLTMHGGEGALHVVVQAERADTEALLRRHIALLRNDLADIGYADVSFSFDDDRAAGDRPGRASAPEAPDIAPADMTASAAKMPAAGTTSARGTLDLRL